MKSLPDYVVFLKNFEVVQTMNMTFSKVDFILAFAISLSDRTFQLRSLSGLVCGEQDLLKTNKNFVFVFFFVFFLPQAQIFLKNLKKKQKKLVLVYKRSCSTHTKPGRDRN